MPEPFKLSEDVIRLVDHVSYKKTEGSLYLMSERLGWMTNTSTAFKISEPYKNVRMQRVSPDDKEKVQLQILLYSNSSYTFHFIHPNGKEKQMRDRNDVKNQLQRLLPKFKERAHGELDHKKKLCDNNPQILELYRDLVTNKYVSKEEFWQQIEQNQELHPKINVKSYPPGIPSYLLTTKPQKDSQTLNLSEKMINDIFAVYPAVKQKHSMLVGENITSENDFWSKFYQSHYFHRLKGDLSQDIFSDCATRDVDEMKKGIRSLKCGSVPVEDKLEDLGDFLQRDEKPDPSSILKQNISSSEECLRRFNRHSVLLLNTMTGNNDKKNNGDLKRHLDAVDLDENSSEEISKAKRMRMIEAADPIYSEEEQWVIGKQPCDLAAGGVKFRTEKVSQFINAISTTQNAARASEEKRGKMEEYKQRWNFIKNTLSASATVNERSHLMSSTVATNVLTEIGYLFSNADDRVKNFNQKLNRMNPSTLQEIDTNIKLLYRSASELLRHFWSCFPVVDQSKFEKLHRMHESVKNFQKNKIEAFNEQHQNQYHLTGSMEAKVTRHLSDMCDKAKEAFERYLVTYKRYTKFLV